MWVYVVALIFLGYLLPHFLVALLPSQDLKKKYGASWALVTGSSSGIGKSIAQKLALQGLNVVLVALDVRARQPRGRGPQSPASAAHSGSQDKLLAETTAELKSAFPKLQFRAVGCNLGATGYLPVLEAATKDIDVQLVFNNAGYMVTGFFDRTPLPKLLANVECNATSAVCVTHLFVTRMLAKKLRGAVVFTSSAAACQPGPFSSMYAATKAFMSSFGASIAVELRSRGVDVCVVHPSPVASRFYENAHKLDAIAFFNQFNVHPDTLPDLIFASIGRAVWRDIGGVAVVFRLSMKCVFPRARLAYISLSPQYRRGLTLTRTSAQAC